MPRANSRSLRHEVERAKAFRGFSDRQIARRDVSHAQFLQEIEIARRHTLFPKAGDIDTLHLQREGREQSHSPRAQYRRFFRPPHLKPSLRFIGLDDAFLYSGRRFQEHRNVIESFRNFDKIFRVIDEQLGEIPVAKVDPPS